MPGPGYSFFGVEERANVERVLEEWMLSRYSYGNGPEPNSFVQSFENATQRVFGSPHSVAVNSGTSALLTSLAGLGIGPGDEVIVPGYTFIASIGSIVHAGATPVLAEIDESLTLDPADVEAKITGRTRALMPVHMLGAPCDLAALDDIARRHGLLVVEDAAQACGGSFRGRRLGSHGDAGAFSLNHFKVITCGEGGFALVSDDVAYQRAYSFQDQGWFPLREESGPGVHLFGLNLRMSEIAAAIACAQLEKLDLILDSVRDLKRELVARIPLREGVHRRVIHDPDGECGTLLVYVFESAKDAAAVAEALGATTMIDSGRHYYGNMPQLHTASAVYERDYRKGALPRTDDILARSVGVSIGVSDSYLGTGFGVSVGAGPSRLDNTAEQFLEALEQVLGP